jgi:YebC/PmpR family DNA-binding regulatory protein
MSGHSKWSQIKRQKASTDAKRGQAFTKLGREIMVAARAGGGELEANFRLRLAVQRAREANMPLENIERAIKRATGGAEGAVLEEITYEGYGPQGAAILVQAMTDNRNRAAAEIRNAFTKAGGALGESGCVAWMFDSRGVIQVETEGKDPDDVTLMAIDAGAEDVNAEDETLEVYTEPAKLDEVRRNLESAGLKVVSAEFDMIPKTTVQLDAKASEQALRLMDKLEDLDDVQKVYSNVEFSEEALDGYEG